MTSLYDAQYEIIRDVIGDLCCVKYESRNGDWTLRPDGHAGSALAVRVMVGWDAEIRVVPVSDSLPAQSANAVTIGRNLPAHVTMNVVKAAVEEFFEAIRHGEEVAL